MSKRPAVLKKKLDEVGWRSPYHEHYKWWQPELGPPQIVNCGPSECIDPDCPKTESGFPSKEQK